MAEQADASILRLVLMPCDRGLAIVGEHFDYALVNEDSQSQVLAADQIPRCGHKKSRRMLSNPIR